MLKKKILHFEIAGIIFTAWGLLIAFTIDIFGLSAVLVHLAVMPLSHIIKFVLYRRVFKDTKTVAKRRKT